MEEAFELIFKQISEQLEKQLKTDVSQQANNEQELGISGKVPFSIAVDGRGGAEYSVTQRGYGATLIVSAIVHEPKGGVFDIDVTSSGGGHISQKEIPAGTSISGTLKMEGWLCYTTIRVKGHSSIPNTTIKGELTYHT